MSDAYLYEPGTSETAAELIRLTRENVDLRVQLDAERARLDWLNSIGFSTTHKSGTGAHDNPGVHKWGNESSWGWTAHWIYSEYRSCRDAIDAAMKGKK